MPHVKNPNAPRILRARNLARLGWLEHGFSTREGGISRLDGRAGILNLAAAAGDRPERVRENQRRFLQALSGKKILKSAPDPQLWPRELRQIHSALVWRDPRPRQAGDGLMTNRSGLRLAIRTADCLPILLADQRLRVVAAVHAGWRGTLARIAERTVGEMRAAYGCRPEDMLAAIGPGIGGCCYEVGPEIVQAFLAQFPQADAFLAAPDPDAMRMRFPNLFLTGTPPGHDYDARWNAESFARLDLKQANFQQLRAAGLGESAIEILPYCTACQPDLFFSYRREGEYAGRHWAVIGVVPDLPEQQLNSNASIHHSLKIASPPRKGGEPKDKSNVFNQKNLKKISKMGCIEQKFPLH